MNVLSPSARIGIVNRGEPAIRFIRGVKEHNLLQQANLTTVAFYLEVDKESLFVKEADEAYPLSIFSQFSQASTSAYLNRSLMIEALKECNCQAVWPGWGFLSEDALFVEMLEEAELIFLGPSAQSMSLLGDKISAKAIAEQNQVPILPWSKGPVTNVARAAEVAEQISYPIIIKAANTGGGRGIRGVYSPEQLEKQFHSAREETLRIAGDDKLFIERLVQTGRHLEVQVLADKHGNVYTFGVRDCSVQRRNQKVIEETPAPLISPERAASMEEAAARLMQATGYESAGTVEFLYDVDRDEFYFMEVNTRLQVEHTVTEEIYRLDFIQCQLAVALGEKISPPQSSYGAAMEVRLNAEDAHHDFVPAPGQITLLQIPTGSGIRVDSGVEQGDSIPAEFDSMIAKIICFANTRQEAIARLRRALASLKIKIEGGTTNRAFLGEILRTEEFQQGGVSTKFVERFLEEKRQQPSQTYWPVVLLAYAIEQYNQAVQEELSNFKQQFSAAGYLKSMAWASGSEVTLRLHGHDYRFFVKAMGETVFHVRIGKSQLVVNYLRRDPERILVYQGKRYTIQIAERGEVLLYEVDGVPHLLEVEFQGIVKAPSPAIVNSLNVQLGGKVAKGDLLLTLEAMKMEMAVTAPQDGVVKQIFVREKEQIAAGYSLLELEKEQESMDEQEVGEKVDFAEFLNKAPLPSQDKLLHEWQDTQREFLALFLGYDATEDPTELFYEMVQFVEQNPKLETSFNHTLLSGLRIFVTIETLFSQKSYQTEKSTRTVTSQDLLLHFFKRSRDREKGLPEEFLTQLQAALSLYSHYRLDKEESTNRSIFRIYKSHMGLEKKQRVLREILLWATRWVKRTPISIRPENALDPSAVDLLDKLIALSQQQSPALVDAAIHARYYLFDRIHWHKTREDNCRKIREVFDYICQFDADIENRQQVLQEMKKSLSKGISDPLLFTSSERSDQENRDKLIESVIEAGSYSIFEIAKIAQEKDTYKSQLALEILAKRLCRDRKIENGQVIARDGLQGYYLHSTQKLGEEAKSSQQSSGFHTQIWVCQPEELLAEMQKIQKSWQEKRLTSPLEVMVWLTMPGEPDSEREQHIISQLAAPADVKINCLCLGFLYDNFQANYRTLVPGQESWQEDISKQGFSPLFYRELKVYRLGNFTVEVVYQSDSVYTILITAKDNPKDKRIFVLAEVSDSRIELDESGHIKRIIAFEHAFAEAIGTMRAQQAHTPLRSHWNRIIIRVHTKSRNNLKQIQEYASKFSHLALGLGLEKIVVYTQSRSANRPKGEVEIVFHNVSGHQFSMQLNSPSEDPIQPMDDYVAKVVKSRQRGMVYPYEIIKMITRSRHYHFYENLRQQFPRGEFAEFDIEVDPETSQQKVVSVAGRPYGQNTSNIIFGIINNYRKGYPEGLKRVIILSDPTGDMGSLAEEECRRVIAALDLAEEQNIPVEWIPVSAGARIDMKSGTENLDWTARVLKRIIDFTQAGGEINVIVASTNVGAQSYWNAEATMLMHTKGVLIMTSDASMMLTGKKALDFSGSVSGKNSVAIGGLEGIMGPNGQAQIWSRDLIDAYQKLFRYYEVTYRPGGKAFPIVRQTNDDPQRDVCQTPYQDRFGAGFQTIGDIFSKAKNPERKKPFDMRQVMQAVLDQDFSPNERWEQMKDAETAIVWEGRIAGQAIALLGIESHPLTRLGPIANDGPETWTGGTLFPQSSKKIARAINSYSQRLPVVVLANLSGFDGSPESLRNLQLEFGAEIGRAVVNFQGPIVFVVVARYHGGAYVVFSQALNPHLRVAALTDTYASVIGGAPAAAVVFAKKVLKDTYADPQVKEARQKLADDPNFHQKDYDDIFQEVHSHKQSQLAQEFDQIHSVQRAQKVGSIHDIISPNELRPYLAKAIAEGMEKYLK